MQIWAIPMSEEAGIDGVEGTSHGLRTPPYIPFKTFLTFLEELKTNGVPPQVDRSVLRRFSGGTASQLLGGLKSLSLIDASNRPNEALVSLVDAYQTDEFSGKLHALLVRGYPYVFDLDLKTATPAMFADAFKNNSSAKEDVLRKCRTFFLHAAQAAGVELGQRLQAGSMPRAASASGKRKPKVPRAKVDEQRPDPGVPSGGAGQGNVVSELLKKFPDFDPAWPDEIKAKWFEGFERFMKGVDAKA